jgi:hypothetical protein
MKKFKKFSYAVIVVFLSLSLFYEPLYLYAQSVEDLSGINSGIGGDTGEVTPADNSDNTTVYVIAGAVVIGIALYFYLKWAEKKRPPLENNEKTEKAETKSDTLVYRKAQARPLSAQKLFANP